MSPPSIRTSLPVELWEKIVDSVRPDAHLSLCRVSKLFHSLAVRSLYYDISLDSPSATAACCRTLANNLNTASAVRNLTITYTPSEPLKYHYFPSFYQLLGRALRCLTNVRDLRLSVLDPNYIQVLARCQFPSLHHFECYLTLTTPLVSFLNQHPSITYLQIAPNEALSPASWPPPTRPGVVLPKLEYFVGNSECISALACDASLRSAFLFWDAVDATPQDAIMALERSSSDTINLLSCRRRGWNLDLIDLISTWLPNIYVLSVTNLLVIDAHPSQVRTKTPRISSAYLDAIRGLLSRFTDLHRLDLHCVDTFRMGEVECRMDDDFATVSGWGAACPTLSECILSHSNGLKWIRVVDDVWVPDPCDHRGVRWLTGMLRSNRFPQWNRVLAVIQQRTQRIPLLGDVEECVEILKSVVIGDQWEL
ncbi:hypothetical protein BDZ94DRAFT_332371 [Collybia nuda]|uniref:F-box domain-containing protein n=1 Tax=Collybia nuda TaxID=64659 RepID=A0A9P5XVV6_9AGAR|nr:hypothetical protein BDZ94DRAFT_332371 [Collybia nuda]